MQTVTYRTASLVGVVLPIINFSFISSIFIISSYRYFVELNESIQRPNGKPMGKKMDAKAKRSILYIIIFSFFGALSALTFLISNSFGTFKHNPIDRVACESVLPKIYSTAYVWANAALYQFLHIRSSLVKSASDNLKYYRWLNQFNKLLANCVPFLGILSLAVWKSEIVVEDGIEYCVDSLRWELTLLFACCSISISILFLILFVWPLWHHYSIMKSECNHNSDAILRVLKWNSKLSVIAMTSTVGSMLLVTAFSIAQVPKSWNILSVSVGDTDISINLICMLLMTNQWLPEYFRNKLSRTTASTHTGQVSPAATNQLVERQFSETALSEKHAIQTSLSFNQDAFHVDSPQS